MQAVFVVERYVPGLTQDDLAALAARLERAADELHVAWLGSTALLEEETTLCVVSAPSHEAVRALNELATAPYERIVDALWVSPSPRAPDRARRRARGAASSPRTAR
jgi:hypothetical protein